MIFCDSDIVVNVCYNNYILHVTLTIIIEVPVRKHGFRVRGSHSPKTKKEKKNNTKDMTFGRSW